MRRRRRLVLLVVTLVAACTTSQAAVSTVWVDSHWTGPGHCGGHVWKVDAFPDIQPAIGAVAAGGRVNVSPGTYRDKITIDHPLTLAGPQGDAQLPPVPEAIVIPAATDLTTPGGILIEVAADNVTVEGLTVDGHNPALTDGIAVNDTTTSAAIGIGADLRNIQGITVRDNIVRNFQLAGIYFKTLGKWSLGNTIANNRIDNMPIRTDSLPYFTQNAITASGIRIAQEWYGVVEDNTITRCAVGIHSSNFTSALSEGDGFEPSPTIKNNHIQAYYDGIIVNLVFDHFYSGPYLVLSNNDITMLPDTNANHPDRYGLCLLGVHGSSRVLAIGNKITGADVGVYAWNNGPRTVNPPIEIDRGSITDCKYGIWATNNIPFGSSETDSTVLLHGTFIRRCETAVFVDDNPKAAHGVAVIVSDGTRIFDGKTGFLIQGGRASLQLLPSWCSVQLTGQSGNYITLAGNGETYPGDISIVSALFGGGEDYHQGKHPPKMTADELKALQAKITDKLSDAKLGRVN